MTRLTTASPDRVRVVGAQHIGPLRRAPTAERAACGRDAIAPSTASIARCRVALAELSTAAHGFARALVFLRPSTDLEPLIEESIDAARPVIDTIRVYPKSACLGASPPSRSEVTTRCAPAGREVAEVITQLEHELDQWKVQLGVG